MRNHPVFVLKLCLILYLLVGLLPATNAVGGTLTKIYTFRGGADGSRPVAALIKDPKSGVLYGTTTTGGSYACVNGCGTVFMLTPPTAEKTIWTETILHKFTGTDGAGPCTSLVENSKGALFGMSCSPSMPGVFELTPPAPGKSVWTEKLIYSGESSPVALLEARDGTLYAETCFGGKYNNGMVFSLSPPTASTNKWKSTVLHNFYGPDGVCPGTGSPLIMDTGGNLYGSTQLGGSLDYGTIFKLSPPALGDLTWKETVIHNFTGGVNDPDSTSLTLLLDPGGALYDGAVTLENPDSVGEVLKLTPAPGHNIWTTSVICKNIGIGQWFSDVGGTLYAFANGDQLVQLTPPATATSKWTETWTSLPNGLGRVTKGANGLLYGINTTGGAYNQGTVVEYIP